MFLLDRFIEEQMPVYSELEATMLSQESMLSEARIAEERFHWLEAAQLYLRVLYSISDRNQRDHAPKSRWHLYEKIISGYIRASFQANQHGQFEERVERAIGVCNKASEETRSIHETGLALYYEAKALQLRSWITETPFARKNLLSQCIRLATMSVEALRETGNSTRNFLRCCLLVLQSHEELWVIERKSEELDRIIHGSILLGQEAVQIFEGHKVTENEDLHLFAKILCLTAWFCGLGVFHFKSKEKRMELRKLSQIYWNKFEFATDSTTDLILLAESYIYRGEDFDPSIVTERASTIISKVMPSGDNQLIGGLLSQIPVTLLLDLEHWKSPNMIKEAENELVQNFGEAKNRFALIKPVGIFLETLAYCYVIPAFWYSSYARRLSSTNDTIERRLELLEKSINVASECYKSLGEYSHRAAIHGAASLARALCDKAKLSSDLESKRKSLDQAAEFSMLGLDLEEIVEPHRDWDYGFFMMIYARIQFEQALIEKEKEKRVSLVKDSIETYTHAMDQMSLAYGQFRDANANLAEESTWYLEDFQEMWNEFYQLTGDAQALTSSLAILEQIRNKEYVATKSAQRSVSTYARPKLKDEFLPNEMERTDDLKTIDKAPIFTFGTTNSKSIFDYLVQAFMDDYVRNKSASGNRAGEVYLK